MSCSMIALLEKFLKKLLESFVVVEEIDEVDVGGLAFLLPRIRERARAVAIGKSSML